MEMRSATRWKPVSTNTIMDGTRITWKNVAYHRVLTPWSAKTHGETAGMEDTSKLTASNIAKTSREDGKNQSKLSSIELDHLNYNLTFEILISLLSFVYSFFATIIFKMASFNSYILKIA